MNACTQKDGALPEGGHGLAAAALRCCPSTFRDMLSMLGENMPTHAPFVAALMRMLDSHDAGAGQSIEERAVGAHLAALRARFKVPA